MNPNLFFNAIIEIMRLSQHMVQLIRASSDDEVTVKAIIPYFEQIQNICNAAKPEIQGYSEHE